MDYNKLTLNEAIEVRGTLVNALTDYPENMDKVKTLASIHKLTQLINLHKMTDGKIH